MMKETTFTKQNLLWLHISITLKKFDKWIFKTNLNCRIRKSYIEWYYQECPVKVSIYIWCEHLPRYYRLLVTLLATLITYLCTHSKQHCTKSPRKNLVENYCIQKHIVTWGAIVLQ